MAVSAGARDSGHVARGGDGGGDYDDGFGGGGGSDGVPLSRQRGRGRASPYASTVDAWQHPRHPHPNRGRRDGGAYGASPPFSPPLSRASRVGGFDAAGDATGARSPAPAAGGSTMTRSPSSSSRGVPSPSGAGVESHHRSGFGAPRSPPSSRGSPGVKRLSYAMPPSFSGRDAGGGGGGGSPLVEQIYGSLHHPRTGGYNHDSPVGRRRGSGAIF